MSEAPASAVVTCDCGASVRIPLPLKSRSFRCPACQAGIALTTEGAALRREMTRSVGATCPICQTIITTEDAAVACPDCDQTHHRDCWAEIGGCGTYGCVQAAALEKPHPEEVPRGAWGDDKTCPACGQKIKAIALKCRFCGTKFDTVDPLTLAEFRRRVHQNRQVAALRRNTMVIFILAVIVCTAPLALILSLAMLMPQRHMLKKAGPIYLLLGYFAVAISGLYSFIILLVIMLR